MATLDTIVVGLGSFGAAATRHLARRGRKVLGIDRFRPPHTSGSHHGGTRLIREAYFEHPGYVPLVQRSMGAWRALERESGRTLLHTTGAIMTGVPGGVLVSGARRSAKLHDLAHEDESPEQLRRRGPALRVPDGFDGLFEPTAGVLLAEACVEAHLEAARRDRAELRFDEPLTRWDADADGVRVETSHGTYEAGTLLLAAGAWTASLVRAARRAPHRRAPDAVLVRGGPAPAPSLPTAFRSS